MLGPMFGCSGLGKPAIAFPGPWRDVPGQAKPPILSLLHGLLCVPTLDTSSTIHHPTSINNPSNTPLWQQALASGAAAAPRTACPPLTSRLPLASAPAHALLNGLILTRGSAISGTVCGTGAGCGEQGEEDEPRMEWVRSAAEQR